MHFLGDEERGVLINFDLEFHIVVLVHQKAYFVASLIFFTRFPGVCGGSFSVKSGSEGSSFRQVSDRYTNMFPRS